MTTLEPFLLAMLLVFAAPYLIWRLGRTDYFVPLVVVQIVSGILLGPSIAGVLLPKFHAFVFTPAVIELLHGISRWAVMLFVCLAGIELDLGKLLVHRKEILVAAGFSLGVPLVFGCLVSIVLLMFSGWAGPKAMSWQFILGIGMACAVTALPVLIMFMDKLEIMGKSLGHRILRYASLDDIAIWGILAVVLLDWSRLGKQAGFLAGFIVVAYIFRKLMVKLPEQDRLYAGLIWLIACSYAASAFGFHYIEGSFLAGAVMELGWFNQKEMTLLRKHVLLLLMPVFFLSTGLRTNWELGGAEVFLVGGVLLAVSVSGKLLGTYFAGRALAWKPGEDRLIGWLLQTKGLILIIFTHALLDGGIISQGMFTALLLMAIASTMLTIPMVAPRLGISRNNY